MEAGRRIDLVLFDLDDTLHDDTYAYQSAAEEVAREVAAEHGIDALALKAAYIVEAEGFWKRLTADDLKVKLATIRASLWQTALERVGAGQDPELARRSAERYNAYRVKYYTLFPGAIDLLRSLRDRGKKLGIVTNGLSETHREKIALLRVSEFFDAIFLADEVGMVKPDPLLFAHACRTLGGSPAHSAMVGDRYDRDIRGAIQAGLYTLWLNVRAEELPPGAAPPDATCGSIAEAGRILLGPACVGK
ncbi:MAG TPA: HAD family hydrolase [Candidatus Cybelea sp.]|jgi:putative hydrolase of the HAD superfamily|nr:HAD family hydrolase [Candidatus Cybelea sp.]